MSSKSSSGPQLVIQTSFLGDTVLTTPLVARLAARGPVDVVCTPASAALLANNPRVREVIAYDKRGRDRGMRGFLRLARRLRERRYGVAYLAQRSLRSAALAVAAGVRERVGFVASAGERLYSVRVPYDDTRHHAARLLSLAGGDSPTDDELRPRLYPGAADDAQAADALRELGASARPLVALAPGSVWGTKRWPYYAELAARLAATCDVIVVGGKDDAEAARAIVGAVRAAGGAAVDATARLSLLASAAMIGRAAVLVTNDSLPQHLASAMGTPTITIFGPTVPTFGFGPLAPRSATAGLDDLPCRPCHHHGPPRCPLGHWRCMRELDVARVDRLLADALTSTQGTR